MELDLALDREGVTLQPSDSSDLLDETAWLQQLERWLNSICGDSSLDCPSLVRAAEEISLGLRFTDDATICELNGTWRQRQEPTDVLSFAALEDAPDWLDDGSVELGDIVISLDTARRQAQEHQHSLQRELQWLTSHGLLHLLGWDHPDDTSLTAMLACQERLLNAAPPANGSNVRPHGPESDTSDAPGDAH